MMKESMLHLKSLNQISLVCRSHLIGGSFDFNSAWLFNYGVGIHLLQSEDPDKMPKKITQINPKDNHISFQISLSL
ncbi:hypothetical protein ACE6H2_005576 [Prunus campanulata]